MQENVNGIMSQYPLRVVSAKLIADKGKKAAWTIVTNEGTKILKKSPATKKRLLFLIEAIKHMQNNGASIPAMVKTRSGKEYSEDSSGNCYVLSEAVQGTSPTYGTADLLMIMKELGRFHYSLKRISIPILRRTKESISAAGSKATRGILSGWKALKEWRKTVTMNLRNCIFFMLTISSIKEKKR